MTDLDILRRRMDVLSGAIRKRRWPDIEFAFDQANRALTKLEAARSTRIGAAATIRERPITVADGTKGMERGR